MKSITDTRHLLLQIAQLKAALKPFADTYRKNADPGTSDLDNEQPVAWHVQLGAYRRASALMATAWVK